MQSENRALTLRMWRYQRGWSRRQLADQANVPYTTICHWEQGRSPRWATRLLVAAALGVPPAAIVEPEQTPA